MSSGFAWYSLSKPIDVPSKSIEIIKYMVRKMLGIEMTHDDQ